MMGLGAQRRQGSERIACAIAALLVTLVIGYALVMGLRPAAMLRALADDTPLALFDLKPPPPERSEPPRPVKPRVARKEGGSHPAPIRAKPKSEQASPPPAMVAPPPVIPVPQPLSPPAAPSAGTGTAINGTGNSGAGGLGDGSGSGGSGTGSGRGEGDGGTFSHARQTGGRFRNSDFPQSARGAGRLKIGVRYAIGPSGRVDKCDIIESSGYAEVDAMTCRIIMERYRFRPARDPDGYAVTEVKEEDYRWKLW